MSEEKQDKKPEVKAFVDVNEEIAENKELNKQQPTIQPKEIDEIDY